MWIVLSPSPYHPRNINTSFAIGFCRISYKIFYVVIAASSTSIIQFGDVTAPSALQTVNLVLGVNSFEFTITAESLLTKTFSVEISRSPGVLPCWSILLKCTPFKRSNHPSAKVAGRAGMLWNGSTFE